MAGSNFPSFPTVIPENKFFPNEPEYFFSYDIGRLFFAISPIWPEAWGGRLEIFNESKHFKIPQANYSDIEPYADITLSPVEIESTRTTKEETYYKVFISDDGDKLRYLANHRTNGKPAANEVLIFIEGDSDTISDQFFAVQIGTQAQLMGRYADEILLSYTSIGKKELADLKESFAKPPGWFQRQLLKITGKDPFLKLSGLLGSWSFTQIINALESLKIPPDVWNPKDDGTNNFIYTLKHINDDLPDVKESIVSFADTAYELVSVLNNKLALKIKGWLLKVADVVGALGNLLVLVLEGFLSVIYGAFSFLMGIINGVIDLISGILFTIKIGIDVLAGIGKTAIQKEFRDSIKEQLDNFFDALAAINFSAIFSNLFNTLKTTVTEIDFEAMFNSLLNKADKGLQEFLNNLKKLTPGKVADTARSGLYHVCYYAGYALTLFIPVGAVYNLMKNTPLLKTTGKYLSWVDEIMEKIFNVTLSALKRTGGVLLGFLRAINTKLKSGTDAIKQIIAKLKTHLDEWLESKGWRKPIKATAESLSEFLSKMPNKATVAFINNASKIPGVEYYFVKKLLVAQFKGTTWFKMDPRGVLVELNFTRKIGKTFKETIAELKDIEIELTFKTENGKNVLKKYKDTVQVVITKNDEGKEMFGFIPKHQPDKVRDAEFVNYSFKRTEEKVLESGEIIYGEPPYATKPSSKSFATDKTLKEGDEFFMVEYQRRDRPGGFAANIEIQTVKELRAVFQVNESMKPTNKSNPFVIRKYRVRAGQTLNVREGYIGNLSTGQATGPKQWEFLDLWGSDFEDVIEEILTDTKILK